MSIKRTSLYSLIVLLTAAFTTILLLPASGGTLTTPIAAPAFTHTRTDDWLNSPPLNWKQLQGKVVLLDFWTFDCWNCYRSFPWLRSLESRLAPQGLQVVGVHTPEFDHEKVKKNILSKVEEFNLHHPIMIDNDFSYWRAMNNRYWPAFYIIDKKGDIRAAFVGETHENDKQAKKIESLINTLLSESQ